MYSIIIPHRNTSRLLERLLQSIPWKHSPQVIVVDNKSTADELRAVESLRSSYHFSLYSSSGCGAGDARNVGLSHADGEWVLFADSDDYYLPDADQLISSHIDDDADIVFFNVTSAFSDSGARAYRDRSVISSRATMSTSLSPQDLLHGALSLTNVSCIASRYDSRV